HLAGAQDQEDLTLMYRYPSGEQPSKEVEFGISQLLQNSEPCRIVFSSSLDKKTKKLKEDSFTGALLVKTGKKVLQYELTLNKHVRVLQTSKLSAYEKYSQSNPQPLLSRIQSQVCVDSKRIFGSKGLIQAQLLSFKKKRVFLHAFLSLVKERNRSILNADSDIWSYFPKARDLDTSLLFWQFVSTRLREQEP